MVSSEEKLIGVIEVLNKKSEGAFNREGVTLLKTSGGMALGITEDVNFSSQHLTLGQGEGLFIYTDGVNEAMDKDGNIFSQQRLTTLLQNSRDASSKEIIENVIAGVKVFSMGTAKSDDITVFSIKYNLSQTVRA